ncbi:YoaP domain-containing protein [Lysinibacillus fusiformis]
MFWTIFGLFYNGKFIKYEIMSPHNFDKLLLNLQLEQC